MNKKTLLGTFSLVMITVGSVDSIRNLPATALFGSHLIFFFLLAAFFFFLPGALVASELSSYKGMNGGVYSWVKEAFGKKWGFLAIWFQWSENVIWYPTILSCVAGTIGYLIAPEIANNKWFLISVILVAFWGTTFLNLMGMKTSAFFANVCAVAGLLIPMTLIISLGAIWLYGAHPSFISFKLQSMIPHLHEHEAWLALTAVMMSFAGIEIATVHSEDVVSPQKAYPRAMLISGAILLFTLIAGSLSIAVAVPTAKISLVSGIMQAFDLFFAQFHIHWILPIIAVMLVIGGLGGVNNWIIAPTRGLYYASIDGHLPKFFTHKNKHNAPSSLLFFQAILVTLISLSFLMFPTINASYWLLTALAAQQYVIMYVLMFLAAIAMRYKGRENVGFKIPGKNVGVWLVSTIGIIGCIVVFIVGFIPPSGSGSTTHYEFFLILGLILLTLFPFIVSKCRR